MSSQLTQLISPLRTSVDEINSNPSVWLNRTVLVEGKLWGPLMIPEFVVYNYRLFRPNATQKSDKVSIKVLWNGWDEYAFEKVILVGVIKEGTRDPGQPIDYYIRAKEIITA